MRNKKLVWSSAIAAAGVAITGSAVGVGVTWAETSPADEASKVKADCEISELSEEHGEAAGVSPSGDYIAGNTYTGNAEGPASAALWKNEKVEDLMPGIQKAYPDMDYATARAVNDEGTVAGDGTNEDGSADSKSFRYQDGEAVALNGAGGESADVSVTGIAADGTVTGVEFDGEKDVPMIWAPDATEGTPIDFPEPISRAAIGDDGTLVGLSESDEAWLKPADGEWKSLEFSADNNAGLDVTGDWVLVGDYRLDLTGDGKPEKHGLAEGGDPNAISAEGQVYGSLKQVPVTDAGDGAEKLPGDFDSSQNNGQAQAVSADGSIVAGASEAGEDEERVGSAYAWNCS